MQGREVNPVTTSPLPAGPVLGFGTEGIGGAPNDIREGAASAASIICHWLSISFTKYILFIGIFKSLWTQNPEVSTDWLLLVLIFFWGGYWWHFPDFFVYLMTKNKQNKIWHLYCDVTAAPSGDSFSPLGSVVHCLGQPGRSPCRAGLQFGEDPGHIRFVSVLWMWSSRVFAWEQEGSILLEPQENVKDRSALKQLLNSFLTLYPHSSKFWQMAVGAVGNHGLGGGNNHLRVHLSPKRCQLKGISCHSPGQSAAEVSQKMGKHSGGLRYLQLWVHHDSPGSQLVARLPLWSLCWGQIGTSA